MTTTTKSINQIKHFDEILTMAQNKLIDFAHNNNIELEVYNKETLYREIMNHFSINNINCIYRGVVEISKNYGFLRSIINNFIPTNYDIYIGNHLIRKFNLQPGDLIECTISQSNDNKQLFAAQTITTINSNKACFSNYPNFYDLVATFPDTSINFINDKHATGKIINLVAPIGFGQRSLIVAPPKAGKTTILRHIIQAILHNYSSDQYAIVILLVGERPEEVTEMKRLIKNQKNVHIFASTFDNKIEHHVRTSESTVTYCKRLAELGKDVVLIMDSLTRLIRAYNMIVPSSGRVLTGGIEPQALQLGKKFFGAARNFATKGSLTIISTCLIETGSRMDDGIHEEFKGTGNSEIYLRRDLANCNLFPAIDIFNSSTREWRRLFDVNSNNKRFILYHTLQTLKDPKNALQYLLKICNNNTVDEVLSSTKQNAIKYSYQNAGK